MLSAEDSRWHAMAQQLELAAAQQDWERVQKLDQMLAQWLQDAGTDVHSITPEVQHHLHSVHAQASRACAQARQLAWEQLNSLQNQQEAQKAYAWQDVLK
ncbi:hypothetical protein [Comamonas sp.]